MNKMNTVIRVCRVHRLSKVCRVQKVGRVLRGHEKNNVSSVSS